MAYKFSDIRLDKGMYSVPGKGFSALLEELDPSEAYRGTPLEGLDAYQRQLKRFGIKVRGAGSDNVEKFFHTTESAVLFPEYVSRSVRQAAYSRDHHEHRRPRLPRRVLRARRRARRPHPCG